MAADSIISAFITGESLLEKDTTGSRYADDHIRQLAYRLYERRGREDGHAVEDWLAAEAQLADGAWTHNVAWFEYDDGATS